MSIETIVIKYLNSKGLTAYAEEQEAPISNYYKIEKTGSSEKDYIKSATITVQSYGKSLLDASNMNIILKNTMRDIVERDDVSSCKCTNDYNYTDTVKKKYRYQAVFQIVYFE